MKVLVTDPMMKQQLMPLLDAVPSDVEWLFCDAGSGELHEMLAAADVFVGSPFTAEMATTAKSLKLVQLPGAGTGGVAFDALPTGVTVANTYHHEYSIAEYVLMSMLALSRRLLIADSRLRQGDWYAVRTDLSRPLPETLVGQTVGLIGFGHIGEQVAKLARVLDMKVIAIKRRPDPELASQHGLDQLGGPEMLPELLRESDFVVVAAPLTEETRGLLGSDELALMKSTAYLINVARGAIIDEAALYASLSQAQIAGAAIDTWYQYPAGNESCLPATYPFHELDNVIMTPHTSGETRPTNAGRAGDIVENVSRLNAGEPLINVVHPA